MPNRTKGVKTLVEEVLATLPTPSSEDVIDEMLLAVEANPTWLTLYNVMRGDLLDLVIEQYENGMRPEDMVRAYDTFGLSDVHAVIAFYLRHRDEVRAYLKRRAEEAQDLRAKIEGERPRVAREVLLARCRARGADHAPTGQ